MLYKRINDNKILMFIILILLLLFSYYIWKINNTLTVNIQMYSGQNSGSNAQVFYSKDKVYSEESSSSFKIDYGNWGKYSIDIVENNIGDIQNIRVDPTENQGNIIIGDISLVKIKGFSKEVLNVNLNRLNLLNQLKSDGQNQDGIELQSLGKDPFFDFNVNDGQWVDYKYYYIPQLFYFFLILLGFLLWVLLEKNVLYNNANLSKLIIYFMVFLLVVGKVFYYIQKVPFGIIPDEIAHLSYITYMKESGKLIPEFGQMRLLNSAGDWTEQVNYLGHPPLYYYFLSLFAENTPHKIVNFYYELRYVNSFLFLFGVVLFLFIGFRRNVSILQHLVYSVAITSIPLLAFEGAGINNDNLGIIGGGLTILGLIKLLENNKGIFYILISFGFFISIFTKLTSGLLSGFLILIVFIYLIKRNGTIAFLVNKGFYFSIAFYILPFVYYLLIYFKYGTVQPSLESLNYNQYINSGFYVKPENAHYLSFTQYLAHFINNLWTSWSWIVASHLVVSKSALESIGLLIIPLSAFLGMFLVFRNKSHEDTSLIISGMGFLSILIVLTIHFIRAYHSHLSTGYLGGIQARYYFPMLPPIIILFINTLEKLKFNMLFFSSIVISLLYSDFYYFILKT